MINLNDPTGSAVIEVLPAKDWACLLGVTDRAVRKAVNQPGGGYIARDLLPAKWREQLNDMIVEQSARDLHHLVAIARGIEEITDPGRVPFASKSELAKNKAFAVREVMHTYFQCIDAGLPSKDAIAAAIEKSTGLFKKPWNERTVRRKRDAIEAARPPGKTVYEVKLDHFADQKEVPHYSARLENKGVVPREFISAFRAKCLEPGMEHVTSAFRFFAIAWMEGKEVPGFGTAPFSGAHFPVKLSQLRKYQPSKASRLQGNRGKAAANVLALPTVTRSHAQLNLCERITFDDTRANIYALDDLTGNVVELKLYFAMDVATRKIVGWLIREAGNVKAADVDALVARVLQKWGFAHPQAGYATTLKFERGCVACSPAKQIILEGLHPGQIYVSRTGMDGGRNAAGDYQQASSGHWFGKGEIESFMRTLAFYTEHFKGQRGGVWKRQPAQLGTVTWRDDGTPRLTQGSMLDEATIIGKAGRSLALMQSAGLDTCPSAAEAAQKFGMHSPLFYVHEVVAALPGVIHYYNTLTDHRRDGFADVREEKPEGGIRFRKESSEERATRLLAHLQARGIAPVTLAESDVSLLLQKAKPVTVTRNGVTFQLDGVSLRYFSPHSAAIREALQNTTLERKCIALFDDEAPDRIHLLKNPVGSWKSGDTAVYWETLPLDVNAPTNNKAAMARAMENTRQIHNAVAREVAVAFEPVLREREAQRESNLDTLRSVTIAHGGLRDAAPGSLLSRQIAEDPGHVVPTDAAPATTREEQRAKAAPSYIARLNAAAAAAEQP